MRYGQCWNRGTTPGISKRRSCSRELSESNATQTLSEGLRISAPGNFCRRWGRGSYRNVREPIRTHRTRQ